MKAKRYRKILTVLAVSLFILAGVIVCAEKMSAGKKAVEASQNLVGTEGYTQETQAIEEVTTEEATKEEVSTVTLMAAGDILIHTPLLSEGLKSDGSYDFSFLFEIMKEDFESADLAVINQESVLGGKELGYDGYPNFNSPDEVGDAIEEAGFDVVLQATNHSMDVGVKGITNSIEYWKTKSDKITMLGFNETEEELNSARYVEKNGIKFALFNYTYGLNGYTLPKGKEYLVNILDDAHKEQIIAEIEKASKEADFVIVFPHWGTEDQLGEPSAFQTKWAKIFTDAGADLIIGAHPHVIQKVEWIETEAGNKSLCYYSLGNYISNQQELNEVLGGIAKVTIVKKNGITTIDESSTGMIPTVTQNDRRGKKPLIQTYRLSDYTEEMAKIHDIYNRFDRTFSLVKLQSTAKEVLGDWIIE